MAETMAAVATRSLTHTLLSTHSLLPTHTAISSATVTLMCRCGPLAFAATDAHDRTTALFQLPARRCLYAFAPCMLLVAVAVLRALDTKRQLAGLNHAAFR